jgi:predicted acetyltransferase
MVSRDEMWAAHRFHDPESDREGASALFFAVLDGPDGSEGYVAYRVKPDWPQGLPSYKLTVEELVALTPEATAALWRHCLTMDLVGSTEAMNRPADEPLLYLLAEPRAAKLTIADGMWLRLVDVPAALAARAYASEDTVVLEVRDDFCPWNERVFALGARSDGSWCAPTNEEPDLALGAAELAAAYLGGSRLESLAAAGRVRELREGALERAGRMFASAPAPWCPFIF